jgi:ketosteroid isomerase-like protein
MKRAVIALCAMLLLSLSVLAQAPKKDAAAKGAAGGGLEAKVRKGWEDFKAGNKDAYAAAMADDSTAVWADMKPPRDKAAQVRDMSSIKLDSYTLSNIKVTPLGPDAALATYTAKVSFTADGKKMTPNMAVTEVWAKRGGEWKCVRYQESEIK